jgi:hypothetical protein
MHSLVASSNVSFRSPFLHRNAFLLGIVLGAFAFPAGDFVRLFPGVWALGLAVGVVLFFHGYYVTRAFVGFCSSLVGAAATSGLMLAANCNLISTAALVRVFSPGLSVASALPFGSHDLSTAALVFVVNSVTVGP